jgi:hypothetical protein
MPVCRLIPQQLWCVSGFPLHTSPLPNNTATVQPYMHVLQVLNGWLLSFDSSCDVCCSATHACLWFKGTALSCMHQLRVIVQVLSLFQQQ